VHDAVSCWGQSVIQVSVVIPTFNREKLLSQTLDALAQQAGGIDYEVIFVNNGSSDNSFALLQERARTQPNRFRAYYIAPTGGPSAPRNHGIRYAKGEIVVILDDDVIPEPDLVFLHWDFHQRHPDPEYVALGEVYIPEDLQDDPMSLFHTFPYHEVSRKEFPEYFYFWTCNVSFKRQFMLQFGMFPEDMLYYEDIVCGYKLANNGMRLCFLPEARGKHLHQLQRTSVPDKGFFIGEWLFKLTQTVPEVAVKERFGILSTEVRVSVLARKIVKRIAFRLTDNPLTTLCLKAFGVEKRSRDSMTDFYYYLIFRRNMIAGYKCAKRRSNKTRKRSSAKRAGSPAADHLDAERGIG